mmetsp:Transcript_17603/g.43007  ORF Transcript_17603/g.43007 Transcript_17603/m.43007 type:complete len:158 (+) Transcript_17603:247-720(+)
MERKLGRHVSDAAAANLLKAVDADSNGIITPEEYAAAISEIESAVHREEEKHHGNVSPKDFERAILKEEAAMMLRQLGDFADLDTDGDGHLSTNEVRAAMERVFRHEVSEAAAQGLVRAVDQNDNGRISAAEYARAISVMSDVVRASHHGGGMEEMG